MQVFKYLSPVFIGVLFFSCSATQKSAAIAPVAETVWQKETLTIDGSDNDWPSELFFYNDKNLISYSVTTDRSYVYILLKTQDEQRQQQILRGGLTVLLNTHGVKDPHDAAGISFPTGNLHQKSNLLSSRPELGNNKNIALSNVQDYALFGFVSLKTIETFDYGKPNPENIEVGIGFNTSGALVYEAAIPFTALYNEHLISYPAGRDLAIGLILEEALTDQGQRNSRGGGLSIGGGIGFGSFGSGGGLGISIGSGALGGGRNRASKQIKIWKEFLVSKPPKEK